MQARLATLALGLTAVWIIPACGASPGPASPTPTPPNTLTGPFSISGTVVENRSGRPIAMAKLSFIGSGSATVYSDASGHFALPSVSSGLLTFSISAAGFLDRASRFTVGSSRADVVLDMISTASPFSLDFYRQFVRNGFDSTTLRPTQPWARAPRFFVNTITQDTGETVPVGVIDGIRRVFENSVLELSAGRFELAAFDTGPEPRTDVADWVYVTFWHAIRDGISGEATVGPSTGGYIKLRYDPLRDAQGLNNPNDCESATVGTAVHEVVHTMGFFHTAQTFDDFQTGPGCPGNGRPERVRHHAAIMYSRPAGNLDPDRDPFEFSIPLGRVSTGLTISCPADDRRRTP